MKKLQKQGIKNENVYCDYIAHHRSLDDKSQSLQDHLLGVSKKTKQLASKIGLEIPGELLGLLHDFGKYGKNFQDYIKSATQLINPDEDDFVDAKGLRGKIDHSSAGAQYIWNALATRGDKVSRMVGQILALCIASHHSGLIDCLRPDGVPIFEQRMKKEDHKTHLAEVTQKANENILIRAKELLHHEGLVNSLRKSILAIYKQDCKNSESPEKSLIAQFKLGLLVRFLFSCLIDADRIDTADFENPNAGKNRYYGHYKQWSLIRNRLEEHLSIFQSDEKINQIRKQISQHCLDRATDDKGFFTLTVPTGGGKTLASLRFALHHAKHHQLDRIIYVTPFTSIIDQNARVVRKILELEGDEKGSIVLEHHSNLTPQLQTWKNKILSENWDAPIVYTTSVQLLETLFGGGTRDVRRMHQLANAIIIFDEIQTLPIYCVHMFCNAINFLVERCKSSVLLCTATQPLLTDLKEKHKGDLNIPKERELMPNVSQLFKDLERVKIFNKIRPEGWIDEDIAQLAIKEMQDSTSCLIIVNTKAAARAIFQKCKQNTKNQVYHLSTDMCPAHRLQILDKIKSVLDGEACEPIICVSTQLIEAGVDIDFGTVIRFVAGMDSIAQAAGRCNRNKKREVGKVYIVNPQFENLDKLPDIKIAQEKTLRVLNEFKSEDDLLNPKIMDCYFKYYFFERSNAMDYPVSSQNPSVGRDDSLLRLLSTNSKTPGELGFFPGLKHSFSSAAEIFKAINSPTQGVIVPYGREGVELINALCSAFHIEKQIDLLKKAQLYTVNVFPHQIQKLYDENAIAEIQAETGILYLKAEYYSENFGLSTTVVGLLPVLNY